MRRRGGRRALESAASLKRSLRFTPLHVLGLLLGAAVCVELGAVPCLDSVLPAVEAGVAAGVLKFESPGRLQ